MMQNKFERTNDNILISKILDKEKFCESKNKITFSDFLNQQEKKLILKNVKLKNCFFYGGVENADREILFFYPEKINEEIARKSLGSIITAIRITLPNENIGIFEHRNYLSALMKIGITREKIGDIIVDEKGADIIVFKTNCQFIMQSLGELTRFKKAKIEEINLCTLKEKIDKFEIKNIIVSSMRIDNIVSELTNCSRNKAVEYIENERVYVNYELVIKNSKVIEIDDIVTVRGKGKFIIDKFERNTKNGKNVLIARKYS